MLSSTRSKLKTRSLFFFFFLFVLLCVLWGNVTATENTATQTYRLSASDKISIRVFNEENLSLETTLGNSGVISFPLLGELNIKGLTLSEVESLITRKLKGPYLLNPRVTVTMLEYRSFFVNGEVARPGGYPYRPGLTVRKAIALAGGLSENASTEKLRLIRENDVTKTPIEAQFDTAVNPGDIVLVMEYQQVYVNGEVKKPGAYAFKPGLTLRKAIALAGGFTERASKKKIFIIREADPGVVDEGAKVLSSNENLRLDSKVKPIKQSIRGKLEDIVQPGDIITIKQSFF